MEEQLLMETLDPYTCRTLVGFGNEIMLSLCVKALARWIAKGLCKNEMMHQHGRVSAARKR